MQLLATPAAREATAPNDFNDMARANGADAVRERIELAVRQAERESTPVRHGPHYRLDAAGVWYIGITPEGDTAEPHWICSPLRVLAKARDAQSENWGRLLSWTDADGQPHQWAAPTAMLVGDGRDFVRELASGGVEIAPSVQSVKRLLTYVMTEPANARARCVLVPGWHGTQYILPTGEVIGATTETIVYQHAGGVALHYGQRGDWRSHVAGGCVGNSRLLLAVSAMFAGPLMRLAHLEGGGIHFAGDSSTGKSSLLKIAASVVGSPRYVREWRTTANGLEGVAVMHNDATLILDELSQIDPNQAGEAVYLLANGSGKSRASRAGDARPTTQWLLQTLSAGELGLAQHMAQAGKAARAGQAVRLAEVPAEPENGHGIYECLHGASSGAELSKRLREAAAEHYGTPWRPWLHWLAAQPENALTDRIKGWQAEFQRDYVPRGANGQVQRVAARFGLAALAGELATEHGLTGWPAGEARRGSGLCFKAWLQQRGGVGNGQETALLAQVRAFFEAHGDSRFENVNGANERAAINRAGYVRGDANGQQFLVFPEAFKNELCKGFDKKMAESCLHRAGWLAMSNDGRPTQKPRIHGAGPVRVYVIDGSAVHGDEPTQPHSDSPFET